MRHTAHSFIIDPTPEQRQALARHAGAARFAYNWGLSNVKSALEARKQDASIKVPWSGFDQINAFNRWKLSADAGVDEQGRPGLAWRSEVSQQVFEEAGVDLGRALNAWLQARQEQGAASRHGFPTYRKRGRHDAFRLRNKKDCVRVLHGGVRVPTLGELKVRQSTRKLRRLLRPRPGDAQVPRILFATLVHKLGRWRIRLNLEVRAFHPAMRGGERTPEVIGIDVGLTSFAVAGRADGTDAWWGLSAKALEKNQRLLRRLSRRMMRNKQRGSRNDQKFRRRLAALHDRVANIRRAQLHGLSSFVAKTHAHVALEDLHIAGMMRNHSLARGIADASWGMFARQVRYKGDWYGCQVLSVNRFAPTSKTCCRCDWVAPSMPLGVRTFLCKQCGWEADRDVNAAANIARWAAVPESVHRQQRGRKISVEA